MKKFILILACFLLLGVISGCSSSPEEKISFDKITIKPNESAGLTTVLGEVTNNNNNKHTFEFMITFYNNEGEILGTANGVVFDLSSKSTKTFEASGNEVFPEDAKYKIQINNII